MKKDFIAVADYSPQELQAILDLSIRLKQERQQNGENRPLLKGKVLAMVFQKPSLRTRVSFDMAMRHLGGDALYLSPQEIGLGQRELVADVARVLAGYVDAIMARVFAHEHVLELARWSKVPVINGLSDYNHPCQAMADGLTILEHFGRIQGLNVTYIGDGNNVAISLMYLLTKLGGHFSIASPDGYVISEESVDLAQKFSQASGSRISLYRDPHEAVKHADVIYTDTWTSMGQEAEAQRRAAVFPPYQVNQQLISEANAEVIVMHCLPAHRGQELTDEVADGPHSAIFQQAENRMHAQKGILAYLFGKG